jgi:hypothetical protein
MRLSASIVHRCAQVLCSLALAASCSAVARAQFTDNFTYATNPALEAVWGAPVLSGATPTTFTYNATGNKLNATQLGDSDVGGYALSTFSRATSFAGNFVARMEFDWNQSSTLGAAFLEVRSATGVIAGGGLGDDTGGPGNAYMQVGGGSTFLGPNGQYVGGATTFETQTGATATNFNNAPIVSAAADAVRNGATLGNVGSARLDIVRTGNQIQAVVSTPTSRFTLGPVTGSTDAVTSVNLIFGGFFFGPNTNVLVGATGTHVAVDRVTLEPRNAPGDANGVGGVTLADYTIIQANSFTSQPAGMNGDVNYDGLVDFKDFHEWKTSFPGGVAAAEAALAGIPEPAGLTLAAGMLATLVGLIRRGRR